jgi:drug/metabolite transporter (DMT)-like permease
MLVGFALGERLSAIAIVGLVIAIPSIALVSWQGRATGVGSSAGWREGTLSGIGFALLFIALNQAGTGSGAWPLIAGQLVALLILLPLALVRRPLAALRRAGGPILVGGVLGGLAMLLFLAATGLGRLAIVAVLTALYPAITIVLARVMLDERWSRVQAAGLIAAAIAIALISFG